VNAEIPEQAGLRHYVLQSESLGYEVGYVVWTPPGYDRNGDERLSTIYFLHGMGGNEASDAGGFSQLMDRAIREGWLPDAIGVFPNGGRSGYQGDVERMIVEELVPRIDADYRTRADRAGRVVAGFSMGGQGAVLLSLRWPHLFSAAGSWGGGLWRGADEVYAAAQEHATLLRDSGYAALLVNGEEDRPDSFAPLSERLAQLDIEHEIVVLPDTRHNLGQYYERNGEQMIRFLGGRLSR
jgi:endo-1,4-beta-xylanase